jgi:hypothetical protein
MDGISRGGALRDANTKLTLHEKLQWDVNPQEKGRRDCNPQGKNILSWLLMDHHFFQVTEI